MHTCLHDSSKCQKLWLPASSMWSKIMTYRTMNVTGEGSCI